MQMRMSKPWVELTESAIDALPAQLGVYEIADDADAVIKIGYAGGREPFGMRTALAAELTLATELGHSVRFRHEFTHGYLTRWQELLMIYQFDHDTLPIGNADQQGKLGRLSPLSTDRGDS